MDVSITPPSGQGHLPVAYEFGAFRLEPAEQRLMNGDQAILLPHRAFDVLVFLVERSPHLVTKEELLAGLWPGLFVEESNITQNVFLLRRALTNGASGHDYIETVPRRGYRFVASVRPVLPTAGAAEKASAPCPRVEFSARAPEVARARRPRVLAVALGLLVLGSLAGAWLIRHRTAPSGLAAVRSIAVLPFRMLGPSAGDDHLGLALADAVITRLGYARAFVVRPTSSTRSLASADDAIAAGRALQVDAVIEGSLQQAEGRIRVTVQLVGVSARAPLWSDKFDVPRADLFRLEDAIAESIAADLAPALPADEHDRLKQRRDTTPAAYEAYLKGRFYWNRRTQDSLHKAVDLFAQAIAADSGYAPAHAGLAVSWNLLGYVDQARAEARRALQLDPTLAEAHAALGNAALFHDFDVNAAEREFRAALRLNPSNTTAHQWRAYGLAAQKRFDEAVAEIELARRIDPLSLSIAADVGDLLFYARRYDEAESECRKAIEMDPHFVEARLVMAEILTEKGEPEAAAAEVTAVAPTGVEDSVRATALVRSGRLAEGRRVLASLSDPYPTNSCYWQYFRADMAASLGQPDEAFTWLEGARAQHCGQMILAGVDPRLDPLRSDPRFADLLRKLGLVS